MKIKINHNYDDKTIIAFLNLFDRNDSETIEEIEVKELLSLICSQILLLKATTSNDWD